jgi:exopolysaccharide biosynthesis operon protein EpsL
MRWAIPAAVVSCGFLTLATVAHGAAEYRDTLEKAMLAPNDFTIDNGDTFDVFAADQFDYDTNLFRLPNSADVATLVGPNATRADHINITSVGLDAQWVTGQQVIDVDLLAADNRFARNTDLDNISGNDKVIWNWRLGPALSGEVGATYYSGLASFVNADVYTKNTIQSTAYFGSGRYQIGPHWAVYGGAQESRVDLSAAASRVNDNKDDVGDVGIEYVTSAATTLGLEYRDTDVTFANHTVVNGTVENLDYHEDLARILFTYTPTDKTTIFTDTGFLKRTYNSGTFPSYSGDVWHVTIDWKPTEKTLLAVDAWRKLQAYLTAESDHFVSTGASIGPVFEASEKVILDGELSWEDQKYVGLIPSVAGPLQRQDHVTGAQANLTYKPITEIILKLSYRHEIRSSDEEQFTYRDNLAYASFTVKF